MRTYRAKGGLEMYDIEHLYMAKSIEDTIHALQRDRSAVIISGGTDVLIKIREGKMDGCNLINISHIEELKGIEVDEEEAIIIKAGTVFSQITDHPIIQKNLLVLGEAVDQVGGPQIRNMGTIGGNVCNGVTSADSGATLYALNAVFILEGPHGVREVGIDQWYKGPGKTIRAHEEVLIAIKIAKKDYENFFGCYIKYGKRKAMEIATLGCAVIVRLSEDKRQIENIRIGYGVAGPNPMRCYHTEQLITGMSVGDETVQILGKEVLKEVTPRSSWRASKEFRIQLVEEMGKRAFMEAIRRAGGTNGA